MRATLFWAGILVLAAVALAAALPVHGQGTTRLLGRVVTLDGDPVRSVRLRIVGHGEPEVYDSGEFDLQLSGRPAQVEVALLDGPLEVIYPPKGMLAVPRDETVRVPVVVGEPEESYINDLLAARLLRLEATLNDNGVAYNASLDSLGEDVRRVLALLELQEADLRHRIDLKRKQADVKPDLLETIDAYLREVKDLRDAFVLVAPHAVARRDAAEQLRLAMEEYNRAAQRLIDKRNAFQSSLLSYWSGAAAEGLTRDLADVYKEALEEIHKGHVLPLNESLITLQLAHGPSKPGREAVRQAVAEVERTGRALGPRIEILEVRYAQLRQALERNE